jgi:ubiquinone/menaquinone biosynthesis C-methylase UbiE
VDRRHVAEIAGRFSHDAPLYERFWASSLASLGRRLLARLPLQNASAALDIGAGVGALLPAIQEAAPRALVIGVDAAEGMIRRAPAEFSRAVMDAGQLAIRDESVDAAVMPFVLFFLPDPLRGLKEARRVLRPGGRLGVATWEAETNDFPADDVWHRLLDEHGAAPEAAPVKHELMDTPEKLATLFRDAGFASVNSAIEREPVAMTLEEFLEQRTEIGRSRCRYESIPPEARRELLAQARERLAGLEAEDFTEPQVAVLAWGTKPGQSS